MEPEEVRNRIRKVLLESLSIDVSQDELDHARGLDQLVGLDSVAILDFVAGLEREFDVTIDPGTLELKILKDLPELARTIADRVAQRRPDGS